MEAWGCEFLDVDHRVSPPPPHESGVFMLPMHILAEIVDSRYLKEIGIKDKAQVQALTADIAQRGIINPGQLVYDNKTVRLQDGNHRYLAAKALQLTEFPVVLFRVANISAPGAPLESMFVHIMLSTIPRR